MTAPTPTAAEIAAARALPGQWLYRVSPHFDPGGRVPPEAVQGAWQIGDDGAITGEFVANAKYDPACRPPAV